MPDALRLLLLVLQGLPALSPLPVEAETWQRNHRVHLPIPLLRRETKRCGTQAAPNATLPTCVAGPAASTLCTIRG